MHVARGPWFFLGISIYKYIYQNLDETLLFKGLTLCTQLHIFSYFINLEQLRKGQSVYDLHLMADMVFNKIPPKKYFMENDKYFVVDMGEKYLLKLT